MDPNGRAFSASRPTPRTMTFYRDGRHHYHRPEEMFYGSGYRWSACCLAGADVATIAEIKGAVLRRDIPHWMTLVREVPFGCCRHRHRGPKEVVYGSGRQQSVCCAIDTVIADPKTWCIHVDECRQYKNTGDIGDTVNSSNMIVSAFASSKVHVLLLGCTSQLLLTEDWSERTKLQETCAFDLGTRSA